jgi:hypothetical protein
VTRLHVPQDILDAAHARKLARLGRDWAEADRLKARIEDGGWRVVDHGSDFALTPLHPQDMVQGGRTRHGWSGSVPPVLAEPSSSPATIVARVGTVAALEAAASLRAGAPSGTQLVLVVVGPDAAVSPILDALDAASDAGVEAVWLGGEAGPVAAWNAGIRRARGRVVILVGAGVRGVGADAISPLILALADEGVAVAGARGLAGTAVQDLAPIDATGFVAAVDDTMLAFRREEFLGLGPLDEQFRSERLAAAWWSLTLRDGPAGGPRRAAVAISGLPIACDETSDGAGLLVVDVIEAERRSRRDRYRLLDTFRDRDDLLVGATGG